MECHEIKGSFRAQETIENYLKKIIIKEPYVTSFLSAFLPFTEAPSVEFHYNRSSRQHMQSGAFQ